MIARCRMSEYNHASKKTDLSFRTWRTNSMGDEPFLFFHWQDDAKEANVCTCGATLGFLYWPSSSFLLSVALAMRLSPSERKPPPWPVKTNIWWHPPSSSRTFRASTHFVPIDAHADDVYGCCNDSIRRLNQTMEIHPPYRVFSCRIQTPFEIH